jgi:hypothetical protein
MGISEYEGYQINKIIEQGKLHAGNSCFFAGNIDAWIKDVVIGFQKITGNHGYGGLPPVMGCFEWRICNPIQADQEKQENPKTDIPKNPTI